MKKVTVRGFLFLNTAGRDPIVQHYPGRKYEGVCLKLITQCDFEVEIPGDDVLTPVTVLADDAEFARLRASINHDALDLAKAICANYDTIEPPIADAARALITQIGRTS